MKRFLMTLLFFVFSWGMEALAQCAMCRASIENNVSNGVLDQGGMGLNAGILYLLVMPYLLVGTIAFFWYQNSKKNRATKQLKVEEYR